MCVADIIFHSFSDSAACLAPPCDTYMSPFTISVRDVPHSAPSVSTVSAQDAPPQFRG